ncbi:hypothetical protein ACOSOMT5_P2953 [Acidiphilium sp. MT5]
MPSSFLSLVREEQPAPSKNAIKAFNSDDAIENKMVRRHRHTSFELRPVLLPLNTHLWLISRPASLSLNLTK